MDPNRNALRNIVGQKITLQAILGILPLEDQWSRGDVYILAWLKFQHSDYKSPQSPYPGEVEAPPMRRAVYYVSNKGVI
jgi:hypothetical protein